ncbi:MAG TPA: glycosyltransferase [Candidatus Andersenbacteria bacterium]|nr:glycosyltransferase [Candidatus Andersenbacteria bacterium]
MDLSIVVPAFKQAQTICSDLTALTTFLDTAHISHEIIVVIDGDIDSTSNQIARDTQLSNIRVITLEENHGKGYALRTGLLEASGTIIGFIDAGGDIEYTCLTIMLDLMKFSGADIIIGSKRHPLSQVEYPLIRHIYSFGYQLLNRMLFHLNVRDTQVGVKLFKKEVLMTILPYVQIDRFAFDLELLVHAKAFGYAHIIESPVRITHRFNSTIHPLIIWETLYDTMGLFFRTFRKRNKTQLSSGISVSFISSPTNAEQSKEYSKR